MRKISYSWLAQLIASIFVLVFVYAAASKLTASDRFVHVLSESPLVKDYAVIIAWSIPIIEILVSFFLIIPAARLGALLASAALMVVFTSYLAYMVAFVPKLPCSCGGILNHLSWPAHLAFNTLLTALALLGIKFEKSAKSFIAIDRNSRIPV